MLLSAANNQNCYLKKTEKIYLFRLVEFYETSSPSLFGLNKTEIIQCHFDFLIFLFSSGHFSPAQIYFFFIQSRNHTYRIGEIIADRFRKKNIADVFPGPNMTFFILLRITEIVTLY